MPVMGQQAQPNTLPERFAQHEKMMSLHLEALHRLRSAVDPLYAALSEEWKLRIGRRSDGIELDQRFRDPPKILVVKRLQLEQEFGRVS
jgi:hypothetical protein